jgi:hypothetical protein
MYMEMEVVQRGLICISMIANVRRHIGAQTFTRVGKQ